MHSIKNTSDDSLDRQTGLNILRIMAAIMVIILHIPTPKNNQLFSINDNINSLMDSFSYCAVNIFALISGFLLSDKKTSSKKLINIWMQVLFYSVLNTLLLILACGQPQGFKGLIKAFLPISSGFQWYATAYVIMYFFIPYFNYLLDNIDFNQSKKLVWTLLVVLGFGGWLLPHIGGGEILGVRYGYSTLWLSVLFLLGSILKKHGIVIIFPFMKNFKNKWYLILALSSGLFIFLSRLLIAKTTEILIGRPQLYGVFLNYCSPVVVFEAVFLLEYFSHINIKNYRLSKFLSIVASTIFGIYLFHNTESFKKLIWNNISNKISNYCLLVIFTVIITFVICSVVDYIRGWLFRTCKIQKLSNYMASIFNSIINKFLKL